MIKDTVMKDNEKPLANNEVPCNHPLQRYCILAKTAHGKDLLQIIEQVLEAPNIYVFGELLAMPNVQELNKDHNIKYFNTLNLFAYGTYKQYRENINDYIELTLAMQKKLQFLTILSLAMQNKRIPYEVLMEELEIKTIRHLQNIIIEAVYDNIIHGKMFQHERYVEIDYSQPRDVPIGYLPKISATLKEWTTSNDLILSSIQNNITQANDIKLQHRRLEQQIMKLKEDVADSSK